MAGTVPRNIDPITIWREFRGHDGRLLSAAIAFYVTLAIAPLGVVSVLIAGLVLTEERAKTELVEQLRVTFGEEVSTFVIEAVERTATPGATWIATVIGVVFTLSVSARLFAMLRRALNSFWGIRVPVSMRVRDAGWEFVLRRFLGFAMLLVTGLVLVFVVIARSVVATAASWLPEVAWLSQASHFSIVFAALTILIVLVYRWLPDAKVDRRDAWIGAAVTAVMATAGSFLIGTYIGRASPASMYGAAGTLVVLLLWIYYTTQIFFFGAKFTQAWARRHSRDIAPRAYARQVVTDASLDEQLGD